MDFSKLATEEVLTATKAALEKNNYKVIIAESGSQAKQMALDLVPKGAEVFALSSTTLQQTGITKEIDESGNYDSVRARLNKLDRATQGREMKRLGAAPEYALGSAHAVTQDGKILIATNTGSQIPADSYGADHIIWVVGTQKIVSDEQEGKKRIYEYVLPLESVRLNKAYNISTGSYVSQILTLYRAYPEGRITVIFVKEALGF
ncbi:MAG: lactate utilization protein [Candidatus Doudnabacteria bacterium]|nr:lactate utilization protein [Candidatus Doudnabacteria bacterium]